MVPTGQRVLDLVRRVQSRKFFHSVVLSLLHPELRTQDSENEYYKRITGTVPGELKRLVVKE